jgi:hypothetical protein
MKECAGATLVNRLFFCLAISIVVCGSLFACRDKGPNAVVAYLQGADQQFENAGQGREIEKALNDMLTLSPDELRTRRYANYQMEPDAWTIIDILHKYFLPSKPTGLDQNRFFRDVTKPEARAVIQERLLEVKKAISLDEGVSDTEENEEEDSNNE